MAGALILLLGLSGVANAQFTAFTLATGSLPGSIVAGPDNALWFTDANLQKIGRISTAGVVSYTSLPSGTSSPRAILRGPDDALWFAHGGDAHAVSRIDPTTLEITKYALPVGARAAILTSGPDGNVWFSINVDSAKFIGRITVPDGVVTVFENPPEAPVSIAVGEGIAGESGTTLLFTGTATDSAEVGKLGRVTTSGELSLVASNLPPGLKYLQAGPDGALWMATGAGQIGRVATGVDITFFDIGAGYRFPQQGFTSGPDGALWMTSQDDNIVRRVSVTGVITEFTPDAAIGAGGMGAITSGPDGNIWFTTGAGSGQTPQIVRLQGTTATALQSSSNPSGVGQPVTFTATVTGTAPGVGNPSGSVTFKDGSDPLGTIPLSGGVAEYSSSGLSAGSHTITATYEGSTNFTTSTSSGVDQTVNKTTTTTGLQSSENPSTANQSVTFTATVSSGSGTPTGTVQFNDGAESIGTGDLSGGEATLTIATLTVGSHSISASYQGNSSYANSDSSALSQVVNQGPTTTGLTSSDAASVNGQSVTFTATITASAGTPAGMVTFMDGLTSLGSAAIASGSAQLSTSTLSIGAHTITAVYSGNSKYEGSQSSGFAQSVDKGETSVSLTATPGKSEPQQSVSFKATVTVTAPATGTISGQVTFKDGSKVLGTGAISAGIATFTTSTLTIGSHTVTASYAGTDKLAASSGSATMKVDARVGPEFLVNSTTLNAQQTPSVSPVGDGFVAAWSSFDESEASWSIFAQRYNRNGARVLGEFRVTVAAEKQYAQPMVIGFPDNGFMISWLSSDINGKKPALQAQRYSAKGAKLDPVFQINKTALKNPSSHSVAALSTGGFVFVWSTEDRTGQGNRIFAQRYDASGKAAGSEFQVNTATTHEQSRPFVAALTEGNFVVTWQSDGQDRSGLGVYSQRFSNLGKAIGKETLVNTEFAGDQSMPVAVGLTNGGFAVVWQGETDEGFGIFGQVFSKAGKKSGHEFLVNSATDHVRESPSIAGFADGGFMVSWQSWEQDGAGSGIYAQAFTAAGKRKDAEFLVNTTTAKDQSQPSVAAFSGGTLVVIWTSRDQDGSLEGVYGQRFKMGVPE